MGPIHLFLTRSELQPGLGPPSGLMLHPWSLIKKHLKAAPAEPMAQQLLEPKQPCLNLLASAKIAPLSHISAFWSAPLASPRMSPAVPYSMQAGVASCPRRRAGLCLLQLAHSLAANAPRSNSQTPAPSQNTFPPHKNHPRGVGLCKKQNAGE